MRSSEIPLSVRQWDKVSHAHTCYFFTRSGSAYLIVEARHGLRHLCQNNINGRHMLITVTRANIKPNTWSHVCARQTREHTRMSQLVTVTHLSTHYTRRHAHAARIDSKSYRASCQGLLTTRTGSAPHASYVGCHMREHTVIPHVRVLGDALCVSGERARVGGGRGRERRSSQQRQSLAVT